MLIQKRNSIVISSFIGTANRSRINGQIIRTWSSCISSSDGRTETKKIPQGDNVKYASASCSFSGNDKPVFRQRTNITTVMFHHRYVPPSRMKHFPPLNI